MHMYHVCSHILVFSLVSFFVDFKPNNYTNYFILLKYTYIYIFTYFLVNGFLLKIPFFLYILAFDKLTNQLWIYSYTTFI